MYGRDYDRECTAAPGVMGHMGCRRYPGCGCGGAASIATHEEEVEAMRDADQAAHGRDVLRALRDLSRVEDTGARSRPYDGSSLTLVLRYDDVVHGTAKALLLRFGDKEVWLPRSEVEVVAGMRVLAPRWLVSKNNLTRFRC